jgi:predicted DNA binding CopG/RHH family protein
MQSLAASTRQGYPARMGQRPIKRDTSVNVRLTSDEREALERLAARNRRTLSDYIRVILQDHVKTEAEVEARVYTEASAKRRAE